MHVYKENQYSCKRAHTNQKYWYKLIVDKSHMCNTTCVACAHSGSLAFADWNKQVAKNPKVERLCLYTGMAFSVLLQVQYSGQYVFWDGYLLRCHSVLSTKQISTLWHFLHVPNTLHRRLRFQHQIGYVCFKCDTVTHWVIINQRKYRTNVCACWEY